MRPTTFKVSKCLNFQTTFNEYIIKNYGTQAVNDKVKGFINSLQQNQNALANLSAVAGNSTFYKKNKELFITYLNQLLLLNTKIPFGNDNLSVKINFQWTDIFKKGFYSSTDFFFEFYNTLFNFGVLLYSLSFYLEKENGEKDENLLKEIGKNYQQAIWIFEKIKEEGATKFSKEQTPLDFSFTSLEYFTVMCKIRTQLILLTIANQKNSSFDVQAKLTQGVSVLFKQAYKLANEQPIAKYGDSAFVQYLQYNGSYYDAMVFFKLRDKYMAEFNTKGTGYGQVIVYEKKAIEKLIECTSIIKKNTKFINIDDIKAEISKEQASLKTMEYNQEKIYRAYTNFELEKVDILIMAKGQQPPEIDLTGTSNINNDLDSLIPKEVKEMITHYKDLMMTFIGQNIDHLQNDKKIKAALSAINLPPQILENTDMKDIHSVEINDDMWARIVDIQKREGIVGLMDKIQDIEKISVDLEEKLRQTLGFLVNEEKEDAFYRNKFGDVKWIRDPSTKINPSFIGAIQKYILSLNQSRPYDQRKKADIFECTKFFEIFGLSRNDINLKIPGNANTESNTQLSEKEKEVKMKVDEVNILSEACKRANENIFKFLNDDVNLVPSFVDVINNKATELAVLENNKVKIQPLFEDLIKLSEEVTSKLEQIQEMVNNLEKNPIYENRKKMINTQVEEFMKNLDNYINMYNSKYDELTKGLNYYLKLKNKIHEVINGAYRYLNRRGEEKVYLLQIITQRIIEPPVPFEMLPFEEEPDQTQYVDENSYLDPSKNLITNMSTQSYTFGNIFKNTGNPRPKMPQNCQSMPPNMPPNNQFMPSNMPPNNQFMPPNNQFMPPNNQFRPPNNQFMPPNMPPNNDFPSLNQFPLNHGNQMGPNGFPQ